LHPLESSKLAYSAMKGRGIQSRKIGDLGSLTLPPPIRLRFHVLRINCGLHEKSAESTDKSVFSHVT
jgi:hypothetical protein